MDGRRVAQIAVLLAALAVLAFGATLIATSRARFGVVFCMLGLLVLLVDAVLLYSQRGGSPVASAPGRSIRLTERHLLHDAVAGVGGATSYELDLYGSARDATALATELGAGLEPLGYRRATPTRGPILRSNAAQVAEFALHRWRWRVYELALPTRFAGVDYSTRDVAHLVAVTLSDDATATGSHDAVPSP